MTKVLVVEHQGDAGIGHIGARLRELGIELVEVGPDTGASVPESLDGFDGLIVLGGSMGPTDDREAPWLPPTRALLAEGVERGVPTLGICLGAQLLTTALDGHVRTMPEGPEIGLLGVRFAPEAQGDALFGGLGGTEVPAVQWHYLEMDVLPEGAELLASSPACRNQAFRVGPRAWGVQFHPEALGPTVRDWAEESLTELDRLGLVADEVVGDVVAAEVELRRTWSGIADRFAELAGRRDEPATEPAATA